MAREGSVVFTWLNLQEFDYRQQLLSAFCSRSSEANFLAERERKGKWAEWLVGVAQQPNRSEASESSLIFFFYCLRFSLASFWLVSSVAFNRIFRQPAGPAGRGVYRRGGT